jgi:hypothetical protein
VRRVTLFARFFSDGAEDEAEDSREAGWRPGERC